jgi:hypothetical protein
VLAGVVLGAVAVAVAGSSAPGVVGVACGASTLSTISGVDSMVTTNIYGGEVVGAETQRNLRHVTGAGDLLAAVAADNRAATLKAVQRIVYHGVWHIVRLRALDAAGRILADVGGQYVIAPVTGVLRSGGAVVGSFVMSVQDDLGFTKLEHRFVGDPIGIYVNGSLVVELGGRFPGVAPGGAGVQLGGIHYGVVELTYGAFPSGTLSAVIAVAPPAAWLAAQPCAAVRADEFGRVAMRFAHLVRPLTRHYFQYVTLVRSYTGAEVFVRDGATQLASSGGLGPAVLPTSGTVSDQGKSWLVFSFEPRAPTRVYVLIPPPRAAVARRTAT